MARKPQNVAMNIGSGRTVMVSVPQKIIDYFGMDAAVQAGSTTTILRERAAHIRKKYKADEISATTDEKPIAVDVSRWNDVGGRQRKGRIRGKLIKLPTEVPNNPADQSKGFRMVSMRVPQAATNYCIAMWINTTFTAKKPSYFLTATGQSYPVAVPTVADPNPGNDTPAPTPAPAA